MENLAQKTVWGKLVSIFEAVEKDKVRTAKWLLRLKPSAIYEVREHSGTPLHLARSGRMVHLLIEKGAEVDAIGWMCATPLHEAASRGDLKAAEALLEAGADPEARADGGDTPLHRAHDAAIVKTLVAAGARDIDARDEVGRTPLHWAAQFGRPDAIRELLRHRAQADARCNDGETPLHWAAREEHLAAVQLLIEVQAPLDAVDETYGNTPLHWAAFRESKEVVELLLAAGASPNIRNSSGETPFHCARDRATRDVAAMLLQQTSGEELGLAASVQHTPLTMASFQSVRMHPRGGRAVSIVRNGRLACWNLSDPPQVTHWIQTPHSHIYDVAVEPSGRLIAVAGEGGPIEIRRWDDLAVVRSITLPSDERATALDYSPDGWFLAAAARDEQIHLIDTAEGEVRSSVDGGERIGCVRFSPSGALLASACSFQGGGFVRVDRVEGRGTLQPLHQLDRSSVYTKSGDFVDSLADIAFTPTGRNLALFETSAIYHDAKPAGWRGEVVMHDVASGVTQWKTPIEGKLTGDRRSLSDAIFPMGFFTQVAAAEHEVACGATRGVVVLLDARTGEPRGRIQLDVKTDVIGVDVEPKRKTLWALTSEGLVPAAAFL